jgi:hypothetical protein
MTTEDFEDDNLEQPANPFREAVEQIAFGDLDQASASLKTAVSSGYQDAEAKRKVDAEKESAKRQIAEFTKSRPHLVGNDMVSAAITRQVLTEEAADLAAIFDMSAWEKQLGRAPTAQEIDKAWLDAKVAGAKVRSASELLEAASNKFEQTFGIQRRPQDPSARILAQKNAARAKRGLPPVEAYGRSSDTDERVATTQSPGDFTSEMFGANVGTEASGQEQVPERAGRISAVQKMKLDRLAARGRKVELWDK